MRERFAITPRTYRRVAVVALAALTGIILTGAAVRLTGSGLGCPDWPKCYGKAIAPLETHAVIEYGNRILSGMVGIAAVAAFAGAFFRRPYRRDLVRLSALLPLGVVAQAVLGGFTVRHHLAPGFVMAHFILAVIMLVAGVALVWRATYEPGERAPATDRVSVWSVRALLPLGAVAIFAGTAATAAGPHAGGAGTGDEINRLEFKGAGTLDWAIHQHARIAAVMGLAAVAVWVLLRRRDADPQARRAMTWLVGLMAAQGAVGSLQYWLELPAEIVWLHVGLAALTWLALVWAAFAIGRLAPREAVEEAERVAPEHADRLVIETVPR